MTDPETGAGWEDPAPDIAPPGAEPGALVLDLDGYEGPIDVLLALARNQKVDLTQLSILQLAEQYLAFIAAARRLDLEIAADYLVMAAWLVYLKSRLLLPADEEEDEEPTGQELAEALAFQLRRLEAVKECGRRLMARPRLGRDVFARGCPEGFEIVRSPVYEASLFDLLSAYGAQRGRAAAEVLRIEPGALHGLAGALERFDRMLGGMAGWRDLMTCLPEDAADGLVFRSAVAATFAAGLELARTGRVELRQPRHLGPVWLRAREAAPGSARGPRHGP